MFKNLKLAFKIGGGFALILVLSIITAIVSLTGFASVSGSIARSNASTAIIDQVRTAIIAGKNFVITSKDEYSAAVDTNLEKAIADAKTLQSQVTVKANVGLLDEIMAAGTGYRENFSKFALFARQGAQIQTAIAEQGNAINSTLDEILVTREAAGSSEYNSLMSTFTQARLQSRTYMMTSTEESYSSTLNLIKTATTLASTLSRSASAPTARSLTAFIDDAKAYQAKVESLHENQVQKTEVQGIAAKQGETAIAKAQELTNSAQAVLTAKIASTQVLVLVAVLLALVLGLVFAIAITKDITKAMALGVKFTQEISGGDLTAKLEIDQNDEIGQLARSLNEMCAKLKDIVMQIQSAAAQVNSGSQQLSSTSQEMSQGASEQASSLEEISSSMEEMSSNIKQNAENAMATEKIAMHSAQIAEDGGHAVNETVEAMKLIATKIGIIEEIARSTNMLALNASIEAARAGEYGKGFAVVASEVGKLAERSQKESGEIKKLSGESVLIAEKAGTTINGMIPEIKRTAELVQEISAASNEQNSGAEQINSAIMQLDQVVQQNASASEESASMSEELSSQANQMRDTISYFKIGKDAAYASAAAVAAPHAHAAKIAHASSLVKSTRSASAAKGSGSVADKAKRVPIGGGVSINLDDDDAPHGRDEIDADYHQF
jgi:methyl-accepting chemotaxis protein